MLTTAVGCSLGTAEQRTQPKQQSPYTSSWLSSFCWCSQEVTEELAATAVLRPRHSGTPSGIYLVFLRAT